MLTFPQFALGDFITAAARQWPDATCFVTPLGDLSDVDNVRRQSFSVTNERVTRLAHALVDNGFQRGDRVAILAVDSIEHMETILACAKAGVTYCDLNFRLRAPELQNILTRSPVRGIFHNERYLPLLEEIKSQIPDVSHWWQYDGSNANYESLLASVDHAPEMAARARGEDILSIMFTSGTTSIPKGVLQSERMMRNIVYSFNREIRLNPGGLQYSGASLFHISGIGSVLHALYAGRASLLLPQFDDAAVLAWLQRGGINSCTLIPTMISAILELPGATDHRYYDLDSILYGGAAMTPALLRKMMATFDCDLYNGLGAGTEAGIQTILTPEDHRAAIAGTEKLFSSIGQAIRGVDLRLCDDELNDVPRGEIGEIVTRSETIMSGYLDQPDLTARSIVDGWFRAGDMAWMDDEGYLFLATRKSDMIIRGGENVYPVEIESTLADHPAVLEVAVVGRDDDHWGELVVAAVKLRDGITVSEDELKSLCRARLASYKVPEHVLFFDALPKNATNKMVKSEIRSMVANLLGAQST
ncbi:MAG: class I adenylate-forming enzyme family protein [Ilumatobacteraceae bacterium]